MRFACSRCPHGEDWGPLEAMHVIDPVDADRIIVADSAAEAIAAVRDVTIPSFGLHYRAPKRRRFLIE